MLEGWFAILKDTIIASGISKDHAKTLAKRMLQKDKYDFIYFHQLRKSKK